MARPKEITIFSTSFLDLLSCGMGAVVLLCLVFAASKKMQGDVTGETNFFTISVESPVGLRGKPLIRVYATVASTDILPGQTDVISNTKISIQPAEQSADAYQVIVTGEGLSHDDRIIVHLVDLNGLHSTKLTAMGVAAVSVVRIKASRAGPGGSSEQEFNLSLSQPLKVASLEGIESPAFEPKWEQP